MLYKELPSFEYQRQARCLVLNCINDLEKEQARSENRVPINYTMRHPFFYQTLYESEFEILTDAITHEDYVILK